MAKGRDKAFFVSVCAGSVTVFTMSSSRVLLLETLISTSVSSAIAAIKLIHSEIDSVAGVVVMAMS